MYTSEHVFNNLSSIKIEAGDNDEFGWITKGVMTLKLRSENAGSKVQVTMFEGNHSDNFGLRIEESMLPFFASEFAKHQGM